MAATDPNSLMAYGKCFACEGLDAADVMELALLDQISKTAGGGSGGGENLAQTLAIGNDAGAQPAVNFTALTIGTPVPVALVTVESAGGPNSGVLITSTDNTQYSVVDFLTPTGGGGAQFGLFGGAAGAPNQAFIFNNIGDVGLYAGGALAFVVGTSGSELFDDLLIDGSLTVNGAVSTFNGALAVNGQTDLNVGNTNITGANLQVTCPADFTNSVTLDGLVPGVATNGMLGIDSSNNILAINVGSDKSTEAAGTAATLSDADNILNFGTTDPTTQALEEATYIFIATGTLKYAGATFAGAQTCTISVKDTSLNVQASQIIQLGIRTTATDGAGTFALSGVYDSNAGDDLSIYAALSVNPGAGSVQCVSAKITAIRIR